MRWLVVPVALCVASSVTDACPMLDYARIATPSRPDDTAIYPDGREESIVVAGKLPEPPNHWWLLALAPALLLWPLCRRSVAFEV